MKEELRLLIDLQKIDTDIAKINVKKRELPVQLTQLDEAFAAFKKGVEESGSKLEEANKRHRETEEKLKKAVDSLRKAKERLNEVKTNKEYHAMLKEIESMEKKNGEIEETVIGLLDEIDAQRKALKVKEQELVQEQNQYEAKRIELQRQIESLDSELQERLGKGEALRTMVPPALLKKYETIKTINKGVAVVSVWKEVCSGCHMNIPPQMYNELLSSEELFSCPQCNRIIYWYDQQQSNGV